MFKGDHSCQPCARAGKSALSDWFGRCLDYQVYFFDVFYSRLFDRSSLFKDFFKGDMKKKGKVRRTCFCSRPVLMAEMLLLCIKQILIRIMEFFCSLDVNNLNAFYSNMMGLSRMHHKMGIRPWMYSVFVEVSTEAVAFSSAQSIYANR